MQKKVDYASHTRALTPKFNLEFQQFEKAQRVISLELELLDI